MKAVDKPVASKMIEETKDYPVDNKKSVEEERKVETKVPQVLEKMPQVDVKPKGKVEDKQQTATAAP